MAKATWVGVFIEPFTALVWSAMLLNKNVVFARNSACKINTDNNSLYFLHGHSSLFAIPTESFRISDAKNSGGRCLQQFNWTLPHCLKDEDVIRIRYKTIRKDT